MRVSIIPVGTNILEAEAEAAKAGARNIKILSSVGQIFCDLEPAGVELLSKNPTILIKEISTVYSHQLTSLGTLVAALNMKDIFGPLRQKYGISGVGTTAVVIDSGVRSSHQALRDKVVYEEDFTGQGDALDCFGHGTAIASIICGDYGSFSGVSPGANIINLRVLDGDGKGLDEAIVEAIDRACELVAHARVLGMHPTEAMYPNTLNISVGVDDTSDVNDPIRIACRVAVRDYGLQVIAAAGNSGPGARTITCPATDADVICVGGILSAEFAPYEQSSRGPTLEGLMKPDMVLWCDGTVGASMESDNAYLTRFGTSFAAPIAVGIDALLWELTRRIRGANSKVTYKDWMQYPSQYFVKPDGAPIQKDNTYGYGFPVVNNMIAKITGVQPASGGIAQDIIPMVTLLAFMPMMVKEMSLRGGNHNKRRKLE